MEITKYLVKSVKIKVFSYTIEEIPVQNNWHFSHISHISPITHISYCFSTSCAYLTSMLTSEQLIAPIQAAVRKSHTRVLNKCTYYLIQHTIDNGVTILNW